ncbi:BQ2448_4158 [Microbotryum intermedium]|uniref:Clathrin light chain n=1 Tax=Microbotryum intermedium TaxID=269621 RepID=A0A238FKF4_9BASI|nr:BQ2448_4158 [Microbotryum intermedium]
MDDFFNPPTESSSSDPTADFLARERAALGETFGDATTTGGAGAGSGSGKDYERSASAFPDLDAPQPQGDHDDDDDDALDFLGGAPAPTSNNTRAVSVTNHTELAAFEQDYPEIEIPSQQQNGYNASLSNNNLFQSSQSPSAPVFQQSGATHNATPSSEQDSEFIQSWRAKQREEIARREEASKAKREETIVKAQHAIDNFYKEYNQKKEKNIAANKDEEVAFNATQTDALAKGTTWERVCALIDLNDSRSKTSTKSKNDLTRFKEVLLSLKREGENAPGAAGY